MNKKEFEKMLGSHLDILLKEEQEKEVRHYLEEIENQERQGLSEEDAIKSLGKLDDIVQRIYTERGIDFSKVYKKHGFIYNHLEQLAQVIHRLVDVMSKNDFKSNLKIVVDILVLFVFVALLKIPFIVVQNLGDTLLGYFSVPALGDIWSLVVDCIYIFVAIIVFIDIFKKYFKNVKVDKKKGLNPKGLESVSLSDQEK